LHAIGGCDFVRAKDVRAIEAVHWTARALPSVVVLVSAGADLLDPRFKLTFPALPSAREDGPSEHILQRGPSTFRIHVGAKADPPAVLLPLDKLFDVRAMAAVRLWRVLQGRNPGPNPAALSPQRRKRLILTLRALDGRLAGASYREIARAMLQVEDMPDAAWQTDERRAQVIRLAQLGANLMSSGYRDLLLYPYRRRT
jgi:hypothetical protein